MASATKKNYYKEKMNRRKEDKKEEPEVPKYRDRAKERREDQNPDYEPAELGAFHAVAPPGAAVLRPAEVNTISIENSKYLGGDLEHTHLVKGLDYALLQKVRSEINVKKSEADDAKEAKLSKVAKEDQILSFRIPTAKSVYQWIVKPLAVSKANEMFLPGRMSFVFNMEEGSFHDIPTTLHRSKADCAVPEEMVSVGVDGSVLDRIAKIMSYLRLGSSGKVLKKKKKKEADSRGFLSSLGNELEEVDKARSQATGQKRESLPPPPPPPPPPSREEEDDIFVGSGVDYAVPGSAPDRSPFSEDMEESPRNREHQDTQQPYFSEPAFGPEPPQSWDTTNGGFDVFQQAQAAAVAYQYAASQVEYAGQYLQAQQSMPEFEAEAAAVVQDPRFMTQEDKDRGLGSVFKRDDQRLQQLREKDAREKDPTFVSESYSECYPGYQEYNCEIVESDDEADLSKMDMGARAKGRLHRWDFETEEEWATYNEQKEATPKAAFQFGVKMQDGRKTRKQNKDQKLTNELHKINRILARKKAGVDNADSADNHDIHDPDPVPPKKLRL
ncbi:RED family protein isoform X2 [Wolffia australiana]